MNRSQYLKTIQAGLEAGEHRFARTAALSWLAAYPGDLQVSLDYARALIGEGRYSQANSTLANICSADPEFYEAALVRVQAELGENGRVQPNTAAAFLALADGLPAHEPALRRLTGKDAQHLRAIAPEWTYALVDARRAISAGEWERAQSSLLPALAAGPAIPLAGMIHLRLVDTGSGPRLAGLNLAEFYHLRWPACLPVSLLLAHWLADRDESRAVSLLHSAAVHDVGGQVPARLWGPQHPYQGLWPSDLELTFDEPIPARVGARLGLNLLDPGRSPSFPFPGRPGASYPQAKNILDSELEEEDDSDELSVDLESLYTGDEWPLSGAEGVHSETGVYDIFAPAPAPARVEPVPPAPAETAPAASHHLPKFRRISPNVRPEQRELKALAKRLGRPDLAAQDGRYPVYVILTTRHGLEKVYGAQGATLVETVLDDLAQAVRSRPHWGASLLLVDEPSCTQAFGFGPARPDDPWGIKLALADLDSALGQRGQRIGALLIVGGPEVVPFHRLPNPVDDDDEFIASDNPYATRDENYFAPAWPVGRMPGGAGREPGLLINLIERSVALHRKAAPPMSMWKRWLRSVLSWLRPSFISSERSAFGFTAAAWRRAAQVVFQPIQERPGLWVSPPRISPNGNGSDPAGRLNLPPASLGYFNLHGICDGPDWYGQSDPYDLPTGSDYPVALRPADLDGMNGAVPRMIFSECCYGGLIDQRVPADSMALKFLSVGAQGIAASTSISYGSLDQPLIAADLLGRLFWDWVKSGLPAGEALRRAKIGLVREMHTRQGYLDGEDQKTLIAFTLYGDPLLQPVPQGAGRMQAKAAPRLPKAVKTVCDLGSQAAEADQVSTETLEYVRHVVARYLPGMEDSQLAYSQERPACSGHHCPNTQIKSLGHPAEDTGRRVVTLSKRMNGSHHRYARLTLGEDGKLVKLVVSR